MELKTLIAECTAYDFKVMLEEKKPKSWLKMAWVAPFSSALIMMASSKDLMTCSMFARLSVAEFVTIWIPCQKWK